MLECRKATGVASVNRKHDVNERASAKFKPEPEQHHGRDTGPLPHM